MRCGYGDGPAALYTTVDTRTRRVGRSRVSRPVMLLLRPASTLNVVTEFGYLSSRIVGLVPSDENRLRVHDSVAGGMRFGYGDEPTALYVAEDDFHLLVTAGNGARGSTKSM
jgi:hypothetical protein